MMRLPAGVQNHILINPDGIARFEALPCAVRRGCPAAEVFFLPFGNGLRLYGRLLSGVIDRRIKHERRAILANVIFHETGIVRIGL